MVRDHVAHRHVYLVRREKKERQLTLYATLCFEMFISQKTLIHIYLWLCAAKTHVYVHERYDPEANQDHPLVPRRDCANWGQAGTESTITTPSGTGSTAGVTAQTGRV